jgi:hypothetical protein
MNHAREEEQEAENDVDQEISSDAVVEQDGDRGQEHREHDQEKFVHEWALQ